jgi:hypothetical protein
MPRKKGGKLPAKKVKEFLNASYDDTPPETINGYILDKSISNKTAKVYHNPETGDAVVAHRGTKGARDWLNNAAYAVGAYKLTDRYKRGKKAQDTAEKKYGKKNVSTLGHSQGAILARELGGDTKEIINVNPAYALEKPKKNEYNVRSSTDIVSGLYAPVAKARSILTPKKSKKHDITIKSKSVLDPLGEHSYEILDRLGDKEIGVGAGIKMFGDCIMKTGGRRTGSLGYSIDDINWLGGVRDDDRERRWEEASRNIPEHRIERDLTDRERDTLRYNYLEIIINSLSPELIENLLAGRLEEIPDDLLEIWDEFVGLRNVILNPEMYYNSAGMIGDTDTEEESEESEESESDNEAYLPDEEDGDAVIQMEEDNQPAPPRPNPFSQRGMEGGIQGTAYLNQGTNPIGVIGGKKPNVGKDLKKFGKKMSKGFEKMAKGTEYINPMMWAIKDKGTRDAMIQSGDIAYNYALPAVVEVGKPVLDVAAAAASTALTGNPLLGKVAADTLWKEMVDKPGYDPRQRQKSEMLGEISKATGKIVAAKAAQKFKPTPSAPVPKGKGRIRGGALPPEIKSQFKHIEKFILSLQRLASYDFIGRSDIELDNFDATISLLSQEIQPLYNYLTEVGRENPSLAGVANELHTRLEASATELDNNLERYDQYLAEMEGEEPEMVGQGKGGKRPYWRTGDVSDELTKLKSSLDELKQLIARVGFGIQTKPKMDEWLDRFEALEGALTTPAHRRRYNKIKNTYFTDVLGGIMRGGRKRPAEEMNRPPEEPMIELALGEEEDDRNSDFLNDLDFLAEEYEQLYQDISRLFEGTEQVPGHLNQVERDVTNWLDLATQVTNYPLIRPDERQGIEQMRQLLTSRWAEWNRFRTSRGITPADIKRLRTGRGRKGGASLDQIGRASVYRSYAPQGHIAYHTLSDIVHSADDPESPNSFVFNNLTTAPDGRAELVLNEYSPSFLRTLYKKVEKMMLNQKMRPQDALVILEALESRDPRVVNNVLNYNNWDTTNTAVINLLKQVKAKNPRAVRAKGV